MNQNYIDIFKRDGIIKIKNFFNNEEVLKIKDTIRPYIGKKGNQETYFPVNTKEKIIKFFKFDFKRIENANFLLKISHDKKMNLMANDLFGEQSYLVTMDSYHTPISNKEVSPWHIDQFYGHKESITDKEIVHPKSCAIKFFIYLSEVGSHNGCTSYIPGSHKITYALRKGIFEKKIKYKPMLWLKDLNNYLSLVEIKNFLYEYFSGSKEMEDMLEKINFINENSDNNKYDFQMSPGDAIIFDEGGVHKGSKTMINERLVLRYHYLIKNIN